MIKSLDRITTLLILLITALYTLEALRFPGGAKIVPAIFGGLALVVAVIQVLSPRVKSFRTLSGELEIDDARDLDVFRDTTARRRLLLIFGSLVAVPFLIAIFGLPLALPIYVAVMLLTQRQSIYVVVACTAIVTLMAYALLVELLAWPLDEGMLWSLFG